jgi:acyl carrier protein phosphodiesterase
LAATGNPGEMNYLAHAYLSFRQPDLLVGNLISDFVKGRAQYDFPTPIQRGIQLHRAIDGFTDQHPINITARKVFKPAVGLYAGAFLDIVYDHYLAVDPLVFGGDQLTVFSNWVYTELETRATSFPPKFALLFPYMKTQNWLSNYQHNWGIEKSMAGVTRRAKYLEDSAPAFAVFEKEYNYLENAYQRFFPELLLYVNNYYRQMMQ